MGRVSRRIGENPRSKPLRLAKRHGNVLARMLSGGSLDMIDDTGFKHVRVKVVAPGLQESVHVLDRIFHNPDVSTTLMEAGIVDGRPFFELDIFGAGSQVDEVLAPQLANAAKSRQSLAEPQEAHV
jgi:hypothetical protein